MLILEPDHLKSDSQNVVNSVPCTLFYKSPCCLVCVPDFYVLVNIYFSYYTYTYIEIPIRFFSENFTPSYGYDSDHDAIWYIMTYIDYRYPQSKIFSV